MQTPLERPLTASHWVCDDCVADDALRHRVVAEGVAGWCNVCGRNGPRVTLEELAEWIDPVYRELYAPGEYEPNFPDAESDRPDWEQRGDSPSWILQGLVGIDVDLAEALVDVLGDRDWVAVRDGDDALYDEGSCYVQVDRHSTAFFDIWNDFERRVKHGRRFHDPEATQLLDSMFSELGSLAAAAGQPHLRVLSPGDPDALLYRARQASDHEEANTFALDPAVHLAPPPAAKRTGGRLNAPGIAVFYGAFRPDTCIAEIRPAVGSWLAVAGFEPTRPLRLLDLTAFSHEPPGGSPFVPGYVEMVERWRFLSIFHSIASAPVQRDEEALRYVPTQIVAEYLANVVGLDGIIYASAQMGGIPVVDEGENSLAESNEAAEPFEHCNVALFDAGDCISVEVTATSEVAKAVPPYLMSEIGFGEPKPARCTGALRYVENTATIHHVAAATYRTVSKPPESPRSEFDPADVDF